MPQFGPGDVRFFHSLDVARLSERATKNGKLLNGSFIGAEPSSASGGDSLDDADPDLEAKCKHLAASHRALRESMTSLLGELVDVMHPRNTEAIGVIEEMLALLAVDATQE